MYIEINTEDRTKANVEGFRYINLLSQTDITKPFNHIISCMQSGHVSYWEYRLL